MNIRSKRRRRFRRDGSGQDILQYAAITGLLALSTAVLLPDSRDSLHSAFNRATAALQRTAAVVRPLAKDSDATGVRAGAGSVAMMNRDGDARAASKRKRR
jgi:Flp pilus assembly pilin Flp